VARRDGVQQVGVPPLEYIEKPPSLGETDDLFLYGTHDGVDQTGETMHVFTLVVDNWKAFNPIIIIPALFTNHSLTLK